MVKMRQFSLMQIKVVREQRKEQPVLLGEVKKNFTKKLDVDGILQAE